MDLSTKMLQWLTQQGFHAVRAGNTALFPRLKSYLVAVGPGKTETKRTLISTYLGSENARCGRGGKPILRAAAFDGADAGGLLGAGAGGSAV